MSAWDNCVTVGSWSPKNNSDFDMGACGKGCSHMGSLGNGGNLLGDGKYVTEWDCAHGSWLMSYDAAELPGWTPCSFQGGRESVVDWEAAAAACVTWLTPLRASGSLGWGDMAFLEDMEFYAAETPEDRAARKEAAAMRDAADVMAVIKSKVTLKEEKWADRSGAMKFRVPRPCRYATLFAQHRCAACGTRVQDGMSSCTAQVVKRPDRYGKLETHLAKEGDTGVRVCGEALAGCWNHDQHRTCIYVHPDEPQWAAACAGTLRVKDDNRLVFCMVGEERPAMRNFGGFAAPQGPTKGQNKPQGNAWNKRK